MAGAEPTPTPTITFDEDTLTYKFSEMSDDFDYVAEFKLKIENAADETIIWSTSDDTIADFVTLDEKDMEPVDLETDPADIIVVFRAYQVGVVNVRATLAADATIYDEFELTIEKDEPVYTTSISEETAKVYIGDDKELTATLYADDIKVEDAVFTWSTSDGAVATVDETTGLVAAVSKGTAKITASTLYGGNTYEVSCDVTVVVPLTDISVENASFYSDGAVQLVVSPVPADAEYDPSHLAFTVDDASAPYIQVSADGTVTAWTQDGLLNIMESSVDTQVKVNYGEMTAQASVTVYQAATSIAIDSATRVVWLGKTALLGVTVLPDNSYDQIDSYASSDEALFTIDETGLISGLALGAGTATVNMKSGRTVDFPVSVLQGTTSLRITVPGGNLRMGEQVQLALTREPEGAVDALTWTSSDETRATVDQNGLVSLIAPGSVTIVVSAQSGETTSVGLGIIRPATAISIYMDMFPTMSGFILAQGQSVEPSINVLPEDATSTGYSLSSSNEAVARTDGSRIYGVANGLATITVTSEDKEVTRTFLVKVVSKSRRIQSVSTNRSSITLKEGKTYTLRARVNSGAQSSKVFWGSVDPSIATVNAKGVVRAVSPGTTYVIAMTYSGVYKRIKVKVTTQMPTSVRLNKSSLSLYADKSYQLTAKIYPSNVLQEQNRVLTWHTTNLRVAVVSDDGMVYTISPGTAYIYARTVNGKTYRCRVTVKKRYVKYVSIENPYGNLLLGGTYTLPATVSPSSATDQRLSWSLASSSYKKYASINSKTGELYCKKPGKIKVRATARDGSRKQYTITLRIVEVPLNSFTMERVATETDSGGPINDKDVIELAYKDSFTVVATVDPVLFLEWSSSDSHVASVKDGLVTATGAGTATITVTAGGCYSRSFTVNVPRDESQPTYRALVIAQYQNSSQKGYLPFSQNCQKGVYDALGNSSIGGVRYELSYRSNLTTGGQLTDAISSTFADAKEGDVSFIYLLSHGTYKDGSYVWHLYSHSGGAYVSASTIMSAMKGVKGHVVLIIPSCYSGGDETIPSTLTYMVRAADRAAADGTSYSAIFASDGLVRASFFNTAESRSYDFFTYSMCKALGWNYMSDASVLLAGDQNGDGYVTVSELASATKSLTTKTLEEYFDTYGTSSYYGPPSKSQNVTYYVSPKAADLAIFGD